MQRKASRAALRSRRTRKQYAPEPITHCLLQLREPRSTSFGRKRDLNWEGSAGTSTRKATSSFWSISTKETSSTELSSWLQRS